MLKIDIVSGFLGAGKTTFIKRLLNTKITNEKLWFPFGMIRIHPEGSFSF